MVKRKQLALALFTASMVIALVWSISWSWDPEPSYNGRKLRQWAEIYEENSNPEDPQQVRKQREAVEAAHQTRDKLLPMAMKMLTYEKPTWKVTMERCLGQMNAYRWCPASIWEPFHEDLGNKNMTYFHMLRSDIAPAVPELVRLASQSGVPGVRERARDALYYLGKKGLPPLIEMFNNPKTPDREYMLSIICRLSEQDAGDKAVMPLLVISLKDPDPYVSYWAARELGSQAVEDETVVPALANCLQSTNTNLRAAAVFALGRYHVKALPAFPILTKVLDDPDEPIRQSATRLLNELAPIALLPPSPRHNPGSLLGSQAAARSPL